MRVRHECGDGIISKKPNLGLVELLASKRALQNKWVYMLKEEEEGNKWYKARFVVNGFAQKKGIDFDEILFFFC